MSKRQRKAAPLSEALFWKRLFKTSILFVSLGPLLGLVATVISIVFGFDPLEADRLASASSSAKHISLALYWMGGGLVFSAVSLPFFAFSLFQIVKLKRKTTQK